MKAILFVFCLVLVEVMGRRSSPLPAQKTARYDSNGIGWGLDMLNVEVEENDFHSITEVSKVRHVMKKDVDGSRSTSTTTTTTKATKKQDSIPSVTTNAELEDLMRFCL